MAMKTLFSRQPWSDEGFALPRSLGEEPHVLAVDDSLVDRKVIERLFKIYSCKVTAVDSVKRALQFLENNSGGLKVDLIITDYSMPELTGYELLKKIKESSAYREIPVVIMSSENIVARIDRCLEEGAEDFIVKPVKLSDMERLKQHLATKHTTLISNKRKQPDLATSPTSSESPAAPLSPDSPSPISEALDSPCRKPRSLSSSDLMELIA
ncbi:hypothetical protein V2J09_003675 [Rumex salicifolius]